MGLNSTQISNRGAPISANNPAAVSLSGNLPNASATQVALAITGAAAAQTLVQLGLTLHADTLQVQVSVETSAVRVCPSGTAASATVGHLIAAGAAVLTLTRAEAVVATFYAAAAATLNVSQSR